jgi:hypothetical protein
VWDDGIVKNNRFLFVGLRFAYADQSVDMGGMKIMPWSGMDLPADIPSPS